MSDSQLRADIGRLLWIGFEGTELDHEFRRVLKVGDAGGVILFGRNVPLVKGDSPTIAEGEADVEALRRLNHELHEAGRASGNDLLISVDQEGGRVQRIKAPLSLVPPMFSFARLPDADAVPAAYALGNKMGAELRQLGFDINFAPVLDVHTNPENPIIGDRAFASTPMSAAVRALAFARGLKQSGILACGKHFPGHGDTDTDSHMALPRLDHSMERLRAVELLPFARAAKEEIPLLMTAHVIFSAVDEQVPATLSREVLTGVLRNELGYRGVVVSDDLDMAAIAANFGVGEAAVSAIEAGCDALLLCRNRDHQEQARTALHLAASQKRGVRDRIAQSAARVRSLTL